MSAHCCEMMRSNVENSCEKHADRADCPDCLIAFWPDEKRYGIMIHDGGSSMVEIAYCPWCGSNLAELSA
ncbi:MAG: DUF6980 family protein [Sphingomonas sp.]